MSPAVRFVNVSRRFGSVRAVDGVTLDIAEGEFFAMLGPSGSGKTTCLRLIAGFEQPNEGHIEIFGETAEGVPPYERNVNTVFQDYALFPHMTVGENVAYGLRIRGIPKAEREAKARDALAMVKLSGYGDRRPSQLSGGQRQRVALARALVNGPKVLLLDEPLGALDLKLREQMQEELKALQKKLGITFVFVTHDQGEALSMADRVAIFNDGKIIQVERRPTSMKSRARASWPTSLGHRTCSRPPSPRATAERKNGPASGPRRSASSRWPHRCRKSMLIPTARSR
jgi:putative spermidine/putrescine transport system ATP-binding protein